MKKIICTNKSKDLKFIEKLIKKDLVIGIDKIEYYNSFSQNIKKLKKNLKKKLQNL